jgi:ATP-binding cassette subfamily B protein
VTPTTMDAATDLASLAWPVARAGEALEALARASGYPLAPRAQSLAGFVPTGVDRDAIARWLDAAVHTLGLEVDAVHVTYAHVDELVRGAGPALLYVEDRDEPRLLVLVGARRGRADVVTPDHARISVSSQVVERAMFHAVRQERLAGVDSLLSRVGMDGARLARAREALLRETVARTRFEAGWMLRLPPSAPVLVQIRHARLTRPMALMLVTSLASHVLSLLAWWMIGRGALGGLLDRGWLVAWALILLTMIPVRVLGAWWQGIVGIGMGGLLKKRMLLGALRLEPEEIRHQGTGQILGRVIESEAVEGLAMGGGFTTVLAVIELAVAAPVLAAGPGGLGAVLLLAAWTVLSLAMTWRYFRRFKGWSRSRIKMTDDLVERMVGHRTRLAQEPPALWHSDEDRTLSDYVDQSTALDRTSTLMSALLPRGWLLLGILGIAPAFVAGGATPSAIAVGLGGVLLARGALAKMTAGIGSLLNATIAWEQAGPLFRAAARPEIMAAPSAQVLHSTAAARGETLLDAHDVVFRYRPQGEPTLRRVSLRIHAGDRLLLEGPSGGGKSTLGSVLTGLRSPESGLLLLTGLDRHTLGSHGWRRRIVAAPQFHENHILSNTFAFNLLMGRGWPPRWEDVAEAGAICRELGLGPLLDRMPGGLMQMVGETGWQLSHGEQSRLFIARALLQRAELIVLDESFAALDPETLSLSLQCVLARAPTLVVIAHP